MLWHVARLEWSVGRALHASDSEPIDAKRLAAVDPALHERIRFMIHPSVSLLRAAYPADAIWRAVLERDDAALAALDISDAPVHLLIQRTTDSVEVIRIDEASFRFTSALVAGGTLGEALAGIDASCAAAVLADHLAARRFVAFELLPWPAGVCSSESRA